jgi:transposase
LAVNQRDFDPIGSSLKTRPYHPRNAVGQSASGGRQLRVYLPPYSPDLNPIEQAFAKLKAHLRKAAEPGKLEILDIDDTFCAAHGAQQPAAEREK